MLTELKENINVIKSFNVWYISIMEVSCVGFFSERKNNLLLFERVTTRRRESKNESKREGSIIHWFTAKVAATTRAE